MSQTAPRPHLLLVGGWQTVNIGDIVHVPAMLALLRREIPEVRVSVWPYKPFTPELLRLYARHFPDVAFLPPAPHPDGRPIDPAALPPETLAAIDSADLLLHNSGPATLAWTHCDAFAARTGRPFGVYGVTYGLYGIPERQTLDRAAFVLFRDSHSLAAARLAGVAPHGHTTPPHLGLALDAAFAADLTDDPAADAFLARHHLTPGHYLCAISRHRNTPFWEMPGHSPTPDQTKLAANDASDDLLTRPVLDAVVAIARTTAMKVLLCPEDMSQIRVNREWIYDRLPADVKPRVVFRDTFWSPAEALSTYVRSAGLFGTEMHSPIMCLAHGVPAVVGRWAEQSTKGYMISDLGLPEWLHDLDDPTARPAFTAAALSLATDPEAARAKAQAAQERIRASQKESMSLVRTELLSAASRRA